MQRGPARGHVSTRHQQTNASFIVTCSDLGKFTRRTKGVPLMPAQPNFQALV